MSVELLQTLSMVAYIVAGVLLLIGAALFFLFDVPKLYGDLSGRTARKAIDAIRKQNESSGNKAYKPSPVNAARGKLTDKISPSGNLIAASVGLGVSVGTEKISTDIMPTTILPEYSNETTVLTSNLPTEEKESEDKAGAFAVDVEISFSGSSEIIE